MQRHNDLTDAEPVSDEEVRALIERFGERQMATHGRPTVKDVAETLQVEPATVAAMLHELRESKSQSEIKERLDRLEQENAELRGRSGSDLSPLVVGFPRRARNQMMAAGLVGVVAFAAIFSLTRGATETVLGVVAVVALVAFVWSRANRGSE